ncbi:MAG: hypothetical protein NT005_02550, partial [Spirochaetes bacterium]|nr:hypothetical protein [Spirochaetota bacterium]
KLLGKTARPPFPELRKAHYFCFLLVLCDTGVGVTKHTLSGIACDKDQPGRAIRNQFIDDVSKGIRKPYKCPYHCLITCDYKNSPYCLALALMNAKKGKLKNGFAFAGANAFREKEIVSVKERMDTLQEEFEAAIHPPTAPGWAPK